MKKIFWIFGLIYPLLYLAAIVIGGIMWPSYSPMSQTISELTSDISPNNQLISYLILAANVALIIFSTGVLLLSLKRKKPPLLLESVVSLVFAGLGVAQFFFPLRALSTGTSVTDIHNSLVVWSSILSVFIILMGIIAFDFLPKLKNISVVAVVIVALGNIQFLRASSIFTDVQGMFEKVAVITTLAWFFCLAYFLYFEKNSDKSDTFVTS